MVLRSTLRSMVAVPAFPVVGEERLLELGLEALEVDDLMLADPFQEKVEGRLGGAARHGVVADAEVNQVGQVGELLERYRLAEVCLDMVQRLASQLIEPFDGHQPV